MLVLWQVDVAVSINKVESPPWAREPLPLPKTILIIRLRAHDRYAGRIVFNKPYEKSSDIDFVRKHFFSTFLPDNFCVTF